METNSSMKIPWRRISLMFLLFLGAFASRVEVSHAQKADDEATGGGVGGGGVEGVDKAVEECDGIFLTYTFISREKEYPRKKNVSAQAWAFESEATILNAGTKTLKAWKMYVGFQNQEILVATDGAVLVDGSDFPAEVGKNGTYLSGNPQADLKNSIETAGDIEQITAKVAFKGTQFGLPAKAVPMPKTIRLVNDGCKCPTPRIRGKRTMFVCCKTDPKYKVKKDDKDSKFLPRQKGDLSLTYDVLDAYSNNYMAQVTIDNLHPLGRLDHWNLTWEWQHNEFIQSMRGAYTHKRDMSACLYGPAGKAYRDMDFSKVMSCDKKPTMTDLPPTMKDDEMIGKLPMCCRNGTVLPTIMNATLSQAQFQLQVFKLPPDDNRTSITPPQKWSIVGPVNPNYVCGPPVRVQPSLFPDPAGLQATYSAVASWQVVCNITKPKVPRCCVSFSGYFTESVVPCNTCACGCKEEETTKCDPKAKAMLLPAEALLVPFANRTQKAKAWAKIKHFNLPKKLPCGDNCGVSLNWHIEADYQSGWTARLTLFNWGREPFQDWFTAIEMDKAYRDYENVYSFNGTRMSKPKNTIFLQGLKGLNYLIEMRNDTNKKNPQVPGKQQSVISFKKKYYHAINIKAGEGYPSRVLFNGEECALPKRFPPSGAIHQASSNVCFVLLVAFASFVFMNDDRFQGLMIGEKKVIDYGNVL